SHRCTIYTPLCLLGHWLAFFSFFFFQAEDGIRDRNVTGVQTCALPILERGWRRRCASPCCSVPRPCPGRRWRSSLGRPCRWWRRSEERRVGKEWRAGWGTED